jgi:hypothetical protein
MTLCFRPFAALYEGIPRDMALPFWAHWEKWVGKSLTKIHVVHGFIWAFFAPGSYVWPKHGVPGGIAGLGFDFLRQHFTAALALCYASGLVNAYSYPLLLVQYLRLLRDSLPAF